MRTYREDIPLGGSTSWLTLYFSFTGRINRKIYWLAGLLPCIGATLGIVLLVLFLAVLSAAVPSLGTTLAVAATISWFTWLILIL